MSAFADVPEMLRSLRRWVGWTAVSLQGRKKPTKQPKIAGTKRNADATDPTDWSDFDVAVSGVDANIHDGIGVTMGEQEGLGRLTLIDFDGGCFDDAGKPHPIVAEWVRRFGSYTEYSPSRRLHVLAPVTRGKPDRMKTVSASRGGKPRESWRCKKVIDGLEIEVFDRDRYATVTGNPYTDSETGEVYLSLADPERGQQAMDAFCDLLWPAGESSGDTSGSDPAGGSGCALTTPQHLAMRSDDEVVAAMCSERKHGAKWADLLAGRWDSHEYPSASEADQALCNKLAFYSGGDAAQVERIFSSHPCGQRSKWQERSDYRASTIGNAMTSVQMRGGRSQEQRGNRDDSERADPATALGTPAATTAYHGITFEPVRLTRSDHIDEVEYEILFEGAQTGVRVRLTPRSKSALNQAARDVAGELGERGIDVTITDTESALRRRALSTQRIERDAANLRQDRDEKALSGTKMCDEAFDAWRRFHRPAFRAPTLTRKSAGFQVWCEANGGGWRYSDALVKVIDASVANAVARADDYRAPDRPNPLHASHKAIEIARITFLGRLLRELPEEDGAEDLGPDSHAAGEMRRVIEDRFLANLRIRSDDESGKQLSVDQCAVSAALVMVEGIRESSGRRTESRWRGAWRAIPGFGGLLFVSVIDPGSAEERISLALSHRAFDRATHAAGKSLAACRTILERYGLAHVGDDGTPRARMRPGKRVEIVELARRVVDHLLRCAERADDRDARDAADRDRDGGGRS